MRLLRVLHEGRARYGVSRPEGIDLIDGDPFSDFGFSGTAIDPAAAEILAPAVPSKIVAIGLNYRDHATELGMEMPEEPLLFLKPASAVIGPGAAIVYPAASDRVEYEAELAVVIKKAAAGISREEAPDHILGYTCANDVTARDLQKRDGQWARAKGFDTFCPLGPWIETDLDPTARSVVLKQNGRVKQDSSTARMVFDVFDLTAFISGVMTLFPGDVILTGTPPGVGPVTIGDTVSVEIDGIGCLDNPVASPGQTEGSGRHG